MILETFDNTPLQAVAATVGTFDGVHTGHKFLLRQLCDEAAHRSLTPVAIVVDPHPLTLIRPERVPARLCDFAARRHMIEQCGVKVCRLRFTPQTRAFTSARFMTRLRDELSVKTLLVGYDNKFGSDRDSGFADYQKTGVSIGVEVIEARCLPGVSSSAVRLELNAGNIERANLLLGYTYLFAGHVTHGNALGRKLQYPTANILPDTPDQLIPAPGVYLTDISTDEKGGFLPSMTNIGYRPTVDADSKKQTIETHILNFDGDLYSRPVQLRFHARLRAERKFDSLADLQTQLDNDARQAHIYFETIK